MKPYELKLKRVPLLPLPAAPDWAELVKSLIVAGVPRTRIANNCRMARETVGAVANGTAEPKWGQGQMLIRLREYVEAAPKPKKHQL